MYFWAKRAIDIICSFLGILVTLPFWLLAVCGIYFSDPGPIFYIAERVGKDNKTFKMYKFRSMRQSKANESVFRGEENRIFAFGKFIRATKIDELPQLINILIGDMSIVGPRPAAVNQLEIVREGRFNIASKVTAGLTGPSALYDYIYGDDIEGEEEYREKVLPTRLELDVFYVENMSFSYDIKMIVYTVICILYRLFKKNPQFIYSELVNSKSTITEDALEETTVS